MSVAGVVLGKQAVTMCEVWCTCNRLSNNSLGAAGAAALAPALRELTALQTLSYVCGCQGRGEGDRWVWVEVEVCGVAVGVCGGEAMVGVSVLACVLSTRTLGSAARP